MAKVAGRSVPGASESPSRNDGELMELAARLDDLARAQEDARGAVAGDDPKYAVAFDHLFIAVSLLNPLYSSAVIRRLANASIT